MDEGRPRTVLIAVDGSGHSEYAFKWLLEKLYQDGDVLIAVVCPQIKYRLSSLCKDDINEDKVRNILKEEETRVQNTMSKFEKLLEKYNVKGQVKNSGGSCPGEAIVQMSQEVKATFVVIGSRGRGVDRCTPTGTVCDYVVEHALVPVMICKDGDCSV